MTAASSSDGAPDDVLTNRFKRRLLAGEVQVGMWTSFAAPLAAEVVAGAGFDWVLIDAEHGTNHPAVVLAQLQAIGGTAAHPIVRPPSGTSGDLQPLVDAGATTFLVPMVESAEQAASTVAAVRFPPRGRRGVAATRSSRWGRVADYWARADDEMCVIAQIESVAGVHALEEIAAVDGIDALFVGPSDLAAALGHIGQPGHPEVRAAVTDAIERGVATGHPVGVFATDPALAEVYRTAGATFFAAGADTAVLAKATAELAAEYGRRLRG